MARDDIFDKRIALKFLGRKFQIKNNKTQAELSKILGWNQSYISSIFNGDASATREKLEEFATKGIGMSKFEFQDLVVDSKAYEFEQTTGRNLTQGDLNSIIEKEFGEIDQKTFEEIEEFIRFKTK